MGEEQGDAVLIVQDNGDISEEKIKNLSEPMSSAKKEGLGLGLAIVKAIVENHAGSISFQKSELEGLKVMVRIPILKTENKNEKNKVEPLIRIVDDEASMRRALTILLEMEGWKVTCYSSAKEFLAEDAPSVPGCVILDVSMPEMTGLQLHSLLVEREYECPIIFLTGHGDIEMAVDSMKKGAVDFLQKPINEEKLLSAIAKAIDWDLSHRGWTVSQEEEMARYESLSKREKEVIGFVAKGLINKEISQRLGLSERTIEVHRLSATKKLKLNAPADIATLISHLEQV